MTDNNESTGSCQNTDFLMICTWVHPIKLQINQEYIENMFITTAWYMIFSNPVYHRAKIESARIEFSVWVKLKIFEFENFPSRLFLRTALLSVYACSSACFPVQRNNAVSLPTCHKSRAWLARSNWCELAVFRALVILFASVAVGGISVSVGVVSLSSFKVGHPHSFSHYSCRRRDAICNLNNVL